MPIPSPLDTAKCFEHVIIIEYSTEQARRPVWWTEPPTKWRDDQLEFCEPSTWCNENVGIKGDDWTRIEGAGMLFYWFKDNQHATMFKLMWSDY